MPTTRAIEIAELSELRGLSLFSGLPEDEFYAAAEVARRTTVPAGAVVINAETAREAIYFVIDGSVRVQVSRENGTEVTLTLLGPGDLVGEMSLVGRNGRSASVTARKQTTLLWMERKAFQRLLEISPHLARNLVRELSARLRAANERLLAMATLDVTGRVALMLLELAERYGWVAPGEGVHIDFPVTQGEVAEMVAATRERVNQIMVRLKKDGVLSIDAESRITVHRTDILQELSRS